MPEAPHGADQTEHTEINKFFASFKPTDNTTATTTTTGRYFDQPLAMDGKIRSVSSDGYATAILEPIFESSHACNIVALPSGELVVAWFSGEDEGGDGIAIVVSRLVPGADTWTRPVVVSQESGRSAQNPVMYHEPGAGGSPPTLTLLHTSQEAYMGQGTAEVRIVRSSDEGLTWGEPRTLFKSPGAFTKNQLLRSADGARWLLPMYYTPDGFFAHESQYSTVQFSSDNGETWTESEPMNGTLGKLVQPSVVRIAGPHLKVFYRSRDADYIFSSESWDDGETWSAPVATELPNNNSGIQATKLRSGKIAIVFNNLQGPFARWPLSVALSADEEGTAWAAVRDLEPYTPGGGGGPGGGGAGGAGDDDPMAGGGGEGEYSYPSIIQTPDDLIHIAYTFRRETVRYARVSEEWILKGGTVGEYKA